MHRVPKDDFFVLFYCVVIAIRANSKGGVNSQRERKRQTRRSRRNKAVSAGQRPRVPGVSAGRAWGAGRNRLQGRASAPCAERAGGR